jgi:glutaconate CoA-transferase subunit B
MPPSRELSLPEVMIGALVPMLTGLRHIAVGASSPVPGSAALLVKSLSGGATRVSLLGSERDNAFTDGGRELFDCAAQGRIDAFFLSGGQIDGHANINLVGLGDYPKSRVRFPGSFGSAYLYHLVPRVILFREEHSPRTLVEQVDFISAAGTSPAGEFRPGGPFALVTGLCVFHFDRSRGRFRLVSTHPGVSIEQVVAATGFAFDRTPEIVTTPELGSGQLQRLRTEVAREIAGTYPGFARKTWGVSGT